jgi:hypothetical protein
MIEPTLTGQVNHVKVVSSHELDGHVLPDSVRILVTIPRDRASLASGVAGAWAGFTGCNFCADDRRSSEKDRGQGSNFVEHLACYGEVESRCLVSQGNQLNCQETYRERG